MLCHREVKARRTDPQEQHSKNDGGALGIFAGVQNVDRVEKTAQSKINIHCGNEPNKILHKARANEPLPCGSGVVNSISSKEPLRVLNLLPPLTTIRQSR
jgi:hypothetical protein